MAHNSKVFATPPVDGTDSLTSAELVALDDGQFTAINGDAGGTWAPSAVIEIGGAGLQVDTLYENVRAVSANYALDSIGPDVVLLVTSSSPGGVTVTLPAAVANRVVTVKHQAGSNATYIAPNGTDTIEGLNATYTLGQIGSSVTLVGISGGWAIVDRGHNATSQTFTTTTSSGWTAPAGCYFVDLEGCGGGGGGAGGRTGTTSTSVSGGGGSGGGGARLMRRRVAVTPNTAYDIAIGAGGAAVLTDITGNDGSPTQFSVHSGSPVASFNGGGGGTKGAAVSASGSIVIGGQGAYGSNSGLLTTYLTSQYSGGPSQGGGGVNSISGFTATDGSASESYNVGGSHGGNGTNSGTSWGAGGGGGGGGGAYGVGANAGAGGNGNGSGVGATGTSGSSASANTGAGGGGGGGGGQGTSSAAPGGGGGAGGSGKLTIFWIE